MVDSFTQRYHSPFPMAHREQEQIHLSALDICTGAGGEALGLEAAGFVHEALAEIDSAACQTVRLNRPAWRVIEGDIREINGLDFRGIDLLAGSSVRMTSATFSPKRCDSLSRRNRQP